jgi:hypothetical protein
MLADVAKEIEIGDGGSPGGVIEQSSGVGRGVKIEQASELFLNFRDVRGKHLGCEELALLGFATGVANGTCSPTRERDWMMSLKLKPAKREEGNEITDVETVGGGVEATVEGEARSDPFGKLR